MRTKTLWIKDEYLNQILNGSKTIEVRVGYPNLSSLEAGDRLLLNDRYLYRIRRIGHYPDFESLLSHEDPAEIAPELKRTALLEVLQELYPPAKEVLGVLAFEIEPLRGSDSR